MEITKNNPYLLNYRLLQFLANNKDYFNNEFLKRIEIFKNKFINSNKIKTDTLENSNKIEQKQRIIDNYIIPLSYLIYGYIYTKYYDIQREKMNIKNNALIFKMYESFFSHKNPAIKRANAYYYLRFQKENDDLKRGNGNGIYLFNFFKTEKTTINKFLKDYIIDTYITKYLDIEDEYNKIKDISGEYEKIDKYSTIIIDNYKKIKEQKLSKNKKEKIDTLAATESESTDATVATTETESTVSTIPSSTNAKLLINNNTLYKKTFIKLINELLEDNKLFINFKKEINIILDNFNNIQNSINIINNKIIELSDNISQINIINIEDLSKSIINTNRNEVMKINNTIEIKYKNNKDIIKNINLLIKNNEAQIEQYNDLYNELFKMNKINKTNKTKINIVNKSLLIPKIMEYYKNSIIYIESIEKLLKQKTKNISSSAHLTTQNISIQKGDANNNPNNSPSNNLFNILSLYFYGLKINFNYENKYILCILNQPPANNSGILNITNTITDKQRIFIDTIREYKKTQTNNNEVKTEQLKTFENEIKKLIPLNIEKLELDNTLNNTINEQNIILLGKNIERLQEQKKNIIKIINKYNKNFFDTLSENIKKKVTNKNTIEFENKTILESNFKKLTDSLKVNGKIPNEIYNSNSYKQYQQNIKKYQQNIKNLKESIIKNNSNKLFNPNDNIDQILQEIDNKINDLNNKYNKNKVTLESIKSGKVKIELNEKIDKIQIDRLNEQKKIITKITEERDNLSIKTADKIDDIKIAFDSAYKFLTSSIKEIDDKIKLIELLNSNNKLKLLFDRKYKNITDIVNIIINDNANNIKIKDKTNINDLLNKINALFTNDLKNEFLSEVYKDIQIKNATNIITNSKSFFDIYTKYYNELIKTIKGLLEKINNDDLVLINNSNNNQLISSINVFNQKIINNKKQLIKHILISHDKNKNSKKGKIKLMLPYTDILYVSLLYLLIIIDFLSYFYRPK